jgi:hypothetical protein
MNGKSIKDYNSWSEQGMCSKVKYEKYSDFLSALHVPSIINS